MNTRIKGIIESMGGKIIKVDNWGKRRLAYEVAKERKGIYLYWQYLAQPGVVEETERNLRMLDNVIRYLTTKVDENIDVAARPTEIDDTSFEKAAQTAADEEDLFLSRGSDDIVERATTTKTTTTRRLQPTKPPARGRRRPRSPTHRGQGVSHDDSHGLSW